MTHCRQAMLEELQRRNFAPTTISYQAYLLRERKMRPLTVRLHVAALRFFFVKTLKRRYLLDDTPYPKAPRRLPQILSVEEVGRLIDAADSLSHRTMLMVLSSTGMRNAELRHLQVAANPKRLGAAIGGLMVLRTWGQRLQHHPHVHCLVPAGGLSPDGTRWIHARPTFFLPVNFARGSDHSIDRRGWSLRSRPLLVGLTSRP